MPVLVVVVLWDNAAAQSACASEKEPTMRSTRLTVALVLSSACGLVLHAQTYTGRIGAGGSSLPSANAGGTVVVAVALSDGLVLAADSRLTIQVPSVSPGYKIASDSASKIFSIDNVGIATFGEAFILDRSINSFVSEFQAGRKKGDATDVDALASAFAEFFTKYYDEHVTERKASPALGFLIVGYDKTGFGRIIELDFPHDKKPYKLRGCPLVRRK